jgi:hypoxanthine phosphoribosyltransferase
MEDLPKCRLATWSEVDRWAERLDELIRASDRVPETIVALTRGGWVPARIMADHFGVKRMIGLRAQHWGVTATKSGKAEVTEGFTTPIADQNVLLIDDITDTGESLALAKEHVEAKHPARLETAVFLHIGHSQFTPDYYAEEIPRDAWVWVVFPWNYWEDVRALVARALGAGANGATEVRTLLKEKSNLDVPLRHVKDTLARPLTPG